MDIISSLNSAFTQVQRSESMSFSTNGEGHKFSSSASESSSGSPVQIMAKRGNQGLLSGANGGSPLRSAVQNVVDYNRSESGTLQLRTQEGDIVTLKFLNSEGMNAQNRQFEGGGSVVPGFSMSGSNSSKFEVVVEGDLNGAELSAIRDVLVQAREAANTFYNGDVKEAFNMASQFNVNSEQLANVNLDLSVTENYTYSSPSFESPNVQAPATPPQGAQPALEAAVPTAPAASPDPLSTPAAIAVPVTAPDLTAVAPASQNYVSQLIQEAPFTPAPLETPVHSEPDSVNSLNGALSTITSFLSQLTASFNSISQPSQGQNSSPAFAFSGGFQLQVVSSMIGQLESQLDQATPSGNALASDTIDLLAQRMDARFDAMV